MFGRRIFLGWMSNWQYAQLVPTTQWRSAMTVPRVLSLITTDGEMVLASNPVTELLTLRGEESNIELTLEKDFPDSDPIDLSPAPIQMTVNIERASAATFKIELANEIGDRVLIGLDSANRFYIDRRQSGITSFSREFPAVHYAPRFMSQSSANLKLLIDTSSIELFADSGTVVMTDLIFPTQPLKNLKMHASGGSVTANIKVYTLTSIWE